MNENAVPVYFMTRPRTRSGAECFAFRWMGQSFASCDNCGHPFWEHTHDMRSNPNKPGLIRRVITQRDRAACKAKWGNS